FQAEDGIRDKLVTGVQTCALPISALKITKKHKSGRQTYGIYAVNNSQEMWGDLVKENGGSFLTPTLKHGALDSPQAIEAIQFARSEERRVGKECRSRWRGGH